jgi:hypothetical protein
VANHLASALDAASPFLMLIDVISAQAAQKRSVRLAESSGGIRMEKLSPECW